MSIINCKHCGQNLRLPEDLWYKGYIPDLNKWAHYNTETGKSCYQSKSS